MVSSPSPSDYPPEDFREIRYFLVLAAIYGPPCILLPTTLVGKVVNAISRPWIARAEHNDSMIFYIVITTYLVLKYT